MKVVLVRDGIGLAQRLQCKAPWVAHGAKPGLALDGVCRSQVEVVVHRLLRGEERNVLHECHRHMSPVDPKVAAVVAPVPVKNDLLRAVTREVLDDVRAREEMAVGDGEGRSASLPRAVDSPHRAVRRAGVDLDCGGDCWARPKQGCGYTYREPQHHRAERPARASGHSNRLFSAGQTMTQLPTIER